MLVLLITTATVFALIALARRAERRFAGYARLPMQWTLGGAVTWTAPRRVALALMPAIGTLVMLATAASAWWLPPHPGQAALVLPMLLLTGVAIVGVQALHLWLVGRQLRRGG